MRLVSSFYRKAYRVASRIRHSLQQLIRVATIFKNIQGGVLPAFVVGLRKSIRVIAKEGRSGLLKRMRQLSRASAQSPVNLSEVSWRSRRLESGQSATPRTTLGRIPLLDIYRLSNNLERAQSVRITRAPLPSNYRNADGLSVIILSKNKPNYLIPLVKQLLVEQKAFHSEGLKLEIIVGDTGSDDPAVLSFYDSVKEKVCIIKGMTYHFSDCNNHLATQAQTDVLLFLNNDIILPEKNGRLLHAYKQYLSSNEHGAFGFVMHYEDGQAVQHMGMDFFVEEAHRGLPFHTNHAQHLPNDLIPSDADYPAVTGASLMVSRRLFVEINGFDPFFEKECQDVALCLDLLRLGYKNKCLNIGKMIHFENGTRDKGEESWNDRAYFLRKYGSFIDSLLSERESNEASKKILVKSKGAVAA